jgi:hypothetical protein
MGRDGGDVAKGHECFRCKQWLSAGVEHDCWTTTDWLREAFDLQDQSATITPKRAKPKAMKPAAPTRKSAERRRS